MSYNIVYFFLTIILINLVAHMGYFLGPTMKSGLCLFYLKRMILMPYLVWNPAQLLRYLLQLYCTM